MSEYLKKLKAANFKNMPPQAPAKPSKATFAGSAGAYPTAFQENDHTFAGFAGGDTGHLLKNRLGQIAAWRTAIEVMPAPCNRDGERLLSASMAFLDNENARAAISLGWDDVALFGIHEGTAPRERIAAWGLVTMLAWSTLKLSVKEIAAGHCSLISQNAQGGSLLTFRRNRAGFAEAVPWWRHPALIGGAS